MRSRLRPAAPRNGYGQHGSHHDTRAADVSWTRLPADRTGGPGVLIRGVIDSVETFGRTVRMYREIESRCDTASVIIRDTIVNEGHTPAPVAVLYHVNLGAPLVVPGTRIDIPAAQHQAREDVAGIPDWQRYPDPLDTITEAGWSHEGLPATAERARASVTSPAGTTLTIDWSADALPRCIQWIFPTRGRWALGIEPANAPLIGPAQEQADAGMPLLMPGAAIQTDLRLAVSFEKQTSSSVNSGHHEEVVMRVFSEQLTGSATLTCYVQDRSEELSSARVRPAALVLPGGGYEYCSDREAEPIALAYLAEGFNAFVLRYAVGRDAPWSQGAVMV